MVGDVRSRLIPDFTAGSVVTTAAVGTAAALGTVAVYSPKAALVTLLVAAFVGFAFHRLPLAVAAFLVLTFPAHLPGSFGAGATLAKPVGALIAVAWAGAVMTRRGALQLLPRALPLFFAAIVGFLLFGGVSMLWAADASQTRSALGRLLLNAVLLLVTYTAASTRSGFRTILHGYLVASVVTSLYSIASGHYIASGRLATLFDPNYFAAELIPAILIASFLFVTASTPRARWLSSLVVGVDLAAFVLTQSRGGIVGLVVGLLAAVVVAGRARPRTVALLLVLVAGGLGYYMAYKPAHVFESSSRAGLGGTSSGRLQQWQVALRVVAGHPIGGVGLGNYQTVEASYTTQTLNLPLVRQIVNDRLVVHNTYLQIAAELGIVGLFVFLTILVLPLRLARRTFASLERGQHELEFHVRGLFAGAIGMLAAYFFLSADFEKPLWLVLALLAGVPPLLHDAGQGVESGAGVDITGPNG